jgi:uncharacterized protein YbjT (DUF2867 family)
MTGLVTVFGGDGFIGRYTVNALLRDGWRVKVASRKSKRGWFLKAQADLGHIAWATADINDRASVARAIEGADAVVNLVGSFDNMDRVHVAGARSIAEAATVAGVKALVHVSAIGADAKSGCDYGRTKGEGEAAVRAAFPAATILRPSIVFGREDAFINRFAGLIRKLPIVPIIGGRAKFQPVYVGDVAKAVSAALGEAHAGKTLELGGPEVLSMAQINRWIAARIGYDRSFIEVPDAAAAMLARTTGWLPAAPITWDQWLMLQKDNVVAEGAAGFEDLGIVPLPLDAVSEGWLVQYRKHGRFADKIAA